VRLDEVIQPNVAKRIKGSVDKPVRVLVKSKPVPGLDGFGGAFSPVNKVEVRILDFQIAE
jgi:hypothetical protein